MAATLARIAAIPISCLPVIVAATRGMAGTVITVVTTMTPVVPVAIAIVVHSRPVVSRTRATVRLRAPVVAVAVTVVPVTMAVVHIVVVEMTQARSPVVMVIVIMTSVIRVTPETVVIHMQVVGQPADREGCRHAPEITRVKRVSIRVGVVIKRIGMRIIVVHGPRLINDDAFRLVVRNVNDVLVRRRDLDHAIFIADGLTIVSLQIAGCVGYVTEPLDGGNDVRLLSNHSLSEPPGPVDILIHEFDDLRVVQECGDGLIPCLVGLQRGIGFEPFQKARRLYDL